MTKPESAPITRAPWYEYALHKVFQSPARAIRMASWFGPQFHVPLAADRKREPEAICLDKHDRVSTLQSGIHNVSTYGSIIGNYKTQYYLNDISRIASPSRCGWYDSGTAITGSVTSPTPGVSGTQYVCTGWTGTGSVAASGSASSTTFTIGAPSSITWNWKTEYYLTVTSPRDSPSPVSGWFDSGTGITESVTSPVSGPSGTQYVCTGWTGTGNAPNDIHVRNRHISQVFSVTFLQLENSVLHDRELTI